jgi:tetratricopeptide (TPR) repeat protein
MSAENKPVVLTCPTCNAPLDFDGLHTLVRCKFCGNTSVVPATLVSGQNTASDGLDAIRTLVNRGDLQGAIQQFQSLFGMDPEEARDAALAINEGRLATLDHSGKHSSSELVEAMQQVQRLAAEGNKEGAVKLYRETFDTSMSLAQKVIEQIANWNPQQPFPSISTTIPSLPVQSSTERRLGGWIAAIILVPLVLIGAMIFFITRGFHYNSLQNDLLVPVANNSEQKIAAEFYDSNKETRFIGLVDVQAGKLLWKTDPLKEVIATLPATSISFLWPMDPI